MNDDRKIVRATAGRVFATPRSVLHAAASAPVFAIAFAGLVPLRLGLVLAVSLVIAAAWHLAVELRAESARRREADRLLVALDTDRVPDKLRWRADELTGARARRVLARSLRNLVRSLDLPPTALATPVNRRALRRNRRAVEALAARLAAIEKPVRPRGVILLRELLCGNPESPLYDTDAAGELRPALVRVRSELEPRSRG